MLSKEKTLQALNLMCELFPGAHGELNAHGSFELLIAVILSAQTTDLAVNKVTPNLFAKYPGCNSLARAEFQDVSDLIKTIGLYRNKSKNIISTAKIIAKDFGGVVPKTREELIKLPGVGRKTANVVLADAFEIPAIAVDTHVERVSKRLKIVNAKAGTSEIEEILRKKLPRELWITAHHTIVFFGRYHCLARNPKCFDCPLLGLVCSSNSRLS